MTFAILLNTFLLALDQYPAQYQELEILNDILSYLFIFEMCAKLLGLGFEDYVSDKFNIFDGSVVMVSLVEIIIA